MIRKGSLVTKQPRKWHDGTPVQGWPRADMLGRVVGQVSTKHNAAPYLRVKWETGRVSLERSAELHKVRDEIIAPEHEPFRNGPDTNF